MHFLFLDISLKALAGKTIITCEKHCWQNDVVLDNKQIKVGGQRAEQTSCVFRNPKA